MRPGRAADHSPPSSAVVKKEYSYTSGPSMDRTACTEPQCLYKGDLYLYLAMVFFSPCGAAAQRKAMASTFLRFLDRTQRRITVGRTPLDEWSARRRDLYLTTHTTHNRQTDIHAHSGIRSHDRSRRTAADLRLRPCGHWDRLAMV